mmetsp:Transcript_31583/g.102005  ORF Transcript_31583/g.102005 Transcript_31583/m.102005 type:complete len:237 (-) Transcript_31583:527-1237(-)
MPSSHQGLEQARPTLERAPHPPGTPSACSSGRSSRLQMPAAKTAAPSTNSPSAGAAPESGVECGVRRPASPHRRREARKAAAWSAAGIRKAMTRHGSPHSASRLGVSVSAAAATSGGRAQRGAVSRREARRVGSTTARLAARTPLKSGKAAVVLSMGSSATAPPAADAHTGGGACGGAQCRERKWRVTSGSVASPKTSAVRQPKSRYTSPHPHKPTRSARRAAAAPPGARRSAGTD